VSTRYLTRPSPGSGRPALASSIATLLTVRIIKAEASLPRRSWPASLHGGDDGTALTLPSCPSVTPRTGARGASYAAFAFAVPGPGAEHFLAQEPTLLLLAVLGALPATPAGVFLEETGIGGRGEPEPHFLAALPAPRTASSCAS
jgi:hypothetical protein